MIGRFFNHRLTILQDMQAYSIARNEQGVFIYIDTTAASAEKVDSIVQYVRSQIDSDNEERELWYHFAAQNLERAYGDDEPDYTHVPAVTLNPLFRHPRPE
jgi:hypothetical protein